MRELSGLKICFVAGTLGPGGAERQLYYMLRVLKGAGADPRVLSLTTGEHWQAIIESLGVPVTWVGQSRSRSRRLVRILRELRRNRPDVIQSQHFFANIYVEAAARLLRITGIGALRGDGFEELESNPGRLGMLSLTLPRIIAANSMAAIDNAVALGARKEAFFFLPNAVDVSLFQRRRRSTSAPLRILAIGSLTPVKRFDRFVALVASLTKTELPSFEALIIGDGPLRHDLEEEARALGVPGDRLRFCGLATDIASFYEQADILVLTSDREGTPNVVLEAMAAGLPVVATRVGGLAEIVREGTTGYLVDREDHAGLLAATKQLMENSQKRIAFGAKAREVAELDHSLDSLEKNLRRLYARVGRISR